MKTAIGKTEEKAPSLHVMLNYDAFGKYKANTLDEYIHKLESMNLSDLQTHAIKLGVKASCDRKRTAKTLCDQFIRDKAKFDLAIIREEQARKPKAVSEKEAAYKAPF